MESWRETHPVRPFRIQLYPQKLNKKMRTFKTKQNYKRVNKKET